MIRKMYHKIDTLMVEWKFYVIRILQSNYLNVYSMVMYAYAMQILNRNMKLRGNNMWFPEKHYHVMSLFNNKCMFTKTGEIYWGFKIPISLWEVEICESINEFRQTKS